jgi:hypothetical protein
VRSCSTLTITYATATTGRSVAFTLRPGRLNGVILVQTDPVVPLSCTSSSRAIDTATVDGRGHQLGRVRSLKSVSA